ncbi:serine hydrolase [Paenibacillus pinihumi]|uniref:serine hydrolase n=1 Tax=Paenibacillus pinihumi TaxID=669462 RepID=UPI00041E19F2|nr:serine hydrolase [Paenibacillus pinihumi]
MEWNQNEVNELTRYTQQIQEQIKASAAALCIMKDNRIVHEWYNGYHHFHKGARTVDNSPQFNVYSTRSTYIGMAVAFAIYDGYISSLDTQLHRYLPDADPDKRLFALKLSDLI